jgi:3'(2'), 5'-bisphosphate nucleotidase
MNFALYPGEQYAVCLALVDAQGQVQLGVLGCPNLPHASMTSDAPRGTLFVAQKGHGAYELPLHDHLTTAARRIHVSPTTNLAEARFCESVEAAHSSHGDAARIAAHLGITRPSLRMDSQCKYGVLARGEVEIYLRLPLPSKKGKGEGWYVENIWDHAAGSIIVQEAGGQVTDMHGKPLDWTRGRKLAGNQGVIATCGDTVASAVLEAIAHATRTKAV